MKRMIASAGAVALTCAVTASGAFAASGSGSSGSGSTSVSGMDRSALMTSMEGDLFEIVGGKLALKTSHTKQADALARTLIKDHTKAYADTVKVARKLGVKIEKTPSPTEMWELRTLAKVRGATFDRWYTSLEVADHKQDIMETTEEITMGTNAAAVADAKQDLPMLKRHLRLSLAASRAVAK
jgi:predicted outer membrane protein